MSVLARMATVFSGAGWVISARPVHPALVNEANFIAAQDINTARARPLRPVRPRRTSRAYRFRNPGKREGAQ